MLMLPAKTVIMPRERIVSAMNGAQPTRVKPVIPITSAPQVRYIRDSARVENCGPSIST